MGGKLQQVPYYVVTSCITEFYILSIPLYRKVYLGPSCFQVELWTFIHHTSAQVMHFIHSAVLMKMVLLYNALIVRYIAAGDTLTLEDCIHSVIN